MKFSNDKWQVLCLGSKSPENTHSGGALLSSSSVEKALGALGGLQTRHECALTAEVVNSIFSCVNSTREWNEGSGYGPLVSISDVVSKCCIQCWVSLKQGIHQQTQKSSVKSHQDGQGWSICTVIEGRGSWACSACRGNGFMRTT